MTAKTKTNIIWGALAVFIAALLLTIGATFAHGQNVQGPTKMPQLNTDFYVGQVSGFYPSIQSAVTQQCAAPGLGSRVIIPAGSPADGASGYTISAVTGGCVKVAIEDRRAIPAGDYKWISTVYVLQSSGGAAPSSPAQSVQLANAGVTGLTSDPNVSVDPTQHQSQITGPGSLAIGVTNPLAGNAINISNRYTTKLNSPVDIIRFTYFGGPGGMNYGNGPGANTLWTTSGFNFWNVTFGRRGITQHTSGTMFKRGTGDFAWNYAAQNYGVGGLTGASDEGGVGSKLNGGEVSDFYSGQATAGAATGSTTLPITAGVQTCDGCFLYDSSKPGPSGHFNGAPAHVTLGTAGYWSEPIDTPVTPSTAYGVPVCNLPQLADQTVPQTVACTVTGALGSTGVFVNGIASISGPYAEQVSITVSAPSGGSQTVNITYRNPHLSGAFVLWQGGTTQGMLQVLPFTTSVAGMPYGETVFGAPDSTHLAASVAQGGGETPPDNNFSPPITFGAVTKSGGTASAVMLIPVQPADSYVPFANLATAVISGTTGCTGGSMDGTVTSVRVNFQTNRISWTDASSSTGCTGGNIGLPISNFSYQLFPYAEQIAAGDVSTSVTLEPNIVPFGPGDNLVQPHPPTFGYNARWDDTRISNPNGHAVSNGLIHSFLGAGIGGGFNPIRLINANPCNLYRGCGGSLGSTPWLQLEGMNYGTIKSTIPINPNSFMLKFDCPTGYNSSPGAPGVCTDTENVLSVPLGAITLDGVKGWTFSGAGLNVNGGLSVSGNTALGGSVSANQYVAGNPVNGAAREALSVVQNFLGPGCANSTGLGVHISGETTRVGFIGYSQDFGSPNFDEWCFALDNSGSYPLILSSSGFSGGPYLATFNAAVTTPSASVLAASTANDLAKFDNATGHLADSGNALLVGQTAPISLALSTCSNTTLAMPGLTQTMAIAASAQTASGPNTTITAFWASPNIANIEVCTGPATVWTNVIVNIAAMGH